MDFFAKQNELGQKSAELREQFEDNKVQFLLTELDTATTFCHVANSSSDPEKIKRNIAHAREGYDTILQFRQDAVFDHESKREFNSKFAHLQSLLKDLGQTI